MKRTCDTSTVKHSPESGGRFPDLLPVKARVGLSGWEEGGVQRDLFEIASIGTTARRAARHDPRKFGKGYLPRGLTRRKLPPQGR
jgi:hypothetical protein